MKRKLNEHDVPEAASSSSAKRGSSTFDDFGLDPRILQAISKERFANPTPVQAQAIPLALEGKDILGICLCWEHPVCVLTHPQPAQRPALERRQRTFSPSYNRSSDARPIPAMSSVPPLLYLFRHGSLLAKSPKQPNHLLPFVRKTSGSRISRGRRTRKCSALAWRTRLI